MQNKYFSVAALFVLVVCSSGDCNHDFVANPDPAESLAYSEASILTAAFRALRPENTTPFAYSYAVDANAVRTLVENGAYSFRIANAINSAGQRIYLLIPVDRNYAMMEVPEYYYGPDRGLCPRICDLSHARMETISADAAIRYAENYSLEYDTIRSFLITHEVTEAMLRNAISHMEISHALRGEERCIVICGVSNGRRLDKAFIQNSSGLCPRICDVY